MSASTTSFALGIEAYTSAFAVETLASLGVPPDKGPILVTGGCSSFAIDMLAGLGYTLMRAPARAPRRAT